MQAERKTAQAERKMKLASIFPRRSRFYPKTRLCLSGTALRCMLRWLLCPGRSPGLTESVSALRTSPRSPGAEIDSFGVVASPKRLSRVATGDPMRHRCAPTNGGCYGVSCLRCDVVSIERQKVLACLLVSARYGMLKMDNCELKRYKNVAVLILMSTFTKNKEKKTTA